MINKELTKKLLAALLIWALVCASEIFLVETTALQGNWLLEMFGPLGLLFGRTLLGWVWGGLSILILFWYFTPKAN
jgi:hypothetical protein